MTNSRARFEFVFLLTFVQIELLVVNFCGRMLSTSLLWSNSKKSTSSRARNILSIHENMDYDDFASPASKIQPMESSGHRK